MKIHILGIVGQMTTPLALALQRLGHTISGSDQDKIYPPFSDIIRQANIPINQGLSSADLVIVGSSFRTFSRCVDEFEQAKNQNIPYISATQYLANNLIKKESILVAGSFGKTTISSLLAHIIPSSNYFFGGQAISGTESLQFSNSDISIIEADESINGLDTQAKFLYYPIKYLVLTSVNWEHKESYPTLADNLNAFKKLIERIPVDGALIYNPSDPNIIKLLPSCSAPTIPYISKTFDSKLIGKYNQDNISAAYTLTQHLRLPPETVLDSISSFQGIRRRLETVSSSNQITVIDDFAQSAERVISALNAVKYSFPDRRILIYFEPHASFLKQSSGLDGFEKIVPLVDKFILGKITFSKTSTNRTTAATWQEKIGEKLLYLPLPDDIVNFFKTNLMAHDILVHFSSGGLEGLTTLKTVYNNIHS
jgi:UDP-N-acetylmuramate: L-alanyl-gamma-D-glutamyl-meso-diaminopimelate ligase